MSAYAKKNSSGIYSTSSFYYGWNICLKQKWNSFSLCPCGRILSLTAFRHVAYAIICGKKGVLKTGRWVYAPNGCSSTERNNRCEKKLGGKHYLCTFDKPKGYGYSDCRNMRLYFPDEQKLHRHSSLPANCTLGRLLQGYVSPLAEDELIPVASPEARHVQGGWQLHWYMRAEMGLGPDSPPHSFPSKILWTGHTHTHTHTCKCRHTCSRNLDCSLSGVAVTTQHQT